MTQAKECCDWNECVEQCAQLLKDDGWHSAAGRVRSLKRAPSHQAGQEGEDDVVARFDEFMRSKGYTVISSAEWPDEANKALEYFWLQSDQLATRIETLERALRAAQKYMPTDLDISPPVTADIVAVRNALDDGGK